MDERAFIAAGYFLTRPVVCPWIDRSGPPRRVLTLNEHLAPTLPNGVFLEGSEPSPGWRERRRLRVANFFSVDPARVEELRRWSVDPANAAEVDWDPGGGSVSLRFVRQTARRFLPAASDAVVLGLAAVADDVDEMARCFGAEDDAPFVPGWIERRARPEAGGRLVGFEPAPILREAPQRACSWICEGLDWDEVERALGLRLDAHGLLDTLEDARRASAWLRARAGLCGGDRWFAWRLTSHAPFASEGR